MQRKYFKLVSFIIIAVFMISPLALQASAAENVNPDDGRYYTNGQTGTVYATDGDGAEVAIANYGATTEYSQSQRFLSTESYPSFYASVETGSVEGFTGDYEYFPLVVRITASGTNPNGGDLSYSDFRVSDTAVSTLTSPPIDNSQPKKTVNAFNLIYSWLKFVSPVALPPLTWEAQGASLDLHSDDSHVWVTYSDYPGPLVPPYQIWNPTHQRALQFCFDLRCILQGEYTITVKYEIEYYGVTIIVHDYVSARAVSYYETVTLTDTIKVRYAGANTIPDTTPPADLNITSPQDEDQFTCDQYGWADGILWGVADVTVCASASDLESGIEGVDMKDNALDWVAATYDEATQQYYHTFALASGEDQTWHTILVQAYDNWGNFATMSVSVLVIRPPPPSIDDQSDFSYAYGTTGHSITWHPESGSPESYRVTEYEIPLGNLVVVAEGSWSGDNVTVNVDGLYVGDHLYSCTVWDTSDEIAFDSVIVTVTQPPPPTIDSPPDISYFFGTTGNVITWHPSSSWPSRYEIYGPYETQLPPESGSWTGGAISKNVDGLSVGTYTYVCDVWDTFDGHAGDVVTVTVAPSPWIGNTNPSGHSYHFSLISNQYGIGGHIDTAGFSGDSGFNFFGYTATTYTTGFDGAIHVQGYFRQSDTFYNDLQPGRRITTLYVMYSSNLGTIVKSVNILDYTDGTDWKYRDVVIGGLAPYASVVIGVGRGDAWDYDWALTAEWAGLQVSSIAYNWQTQTSPSGHYVHYQFLSTAYGYGWHVDTTGRTDLGYQFYSYAWPTFKVGADGKVTIQGWFRQDDTFSGGLENGRRVEYAFLVNPNNPSNIIQSKQILSYTDGTGWVFKTVTFSGLSPGTTFKLGFGRQDNWSYDWHLTSEWAGVSVITSATA